MTNELIFYQSEELPERIEVRLEDDTVWLSQLQMAELFGRGRSTITEHINNIFKEGELIEEVVCRDFRHTTQHGAIEGKSQLTFTRFYNLDVIISVGYRVKSKQGTQFRIWATNVLRDYMLKGYALNQRMNRIENSVESLVNKVDEIDFQIKSKDLPDKGLFYNGQIFDAYTFIAEIIRKAQQSVVLIDNYIDDSVLTILNKREDGVKATIYTSRINKELTLDIKKHNQQYPEINIKTYKQAHDRFLIIDEKELYHIGASLKDLGKKWFGFSRMDSMVKEVMFKLRN